MTQDSFVSFDRCSCGWLADTEYDQVLHYARSHHNVEPLIEFLNKRVDNALESIRNELVKQRVLFATSKEELGFDKGIQAAMRTIDRQTTQFKET